jgi:hypothetical protein
MPEVKNTFVTGIMNKDLDERLIPEGVYIHAENVSVDSADAGDIGAVKNQRGNVLIGNLANVTNRNLTNARTIGAVASERDNLIYWLVAADEFDGIYEYNEISGTLVRVLQSNKSTPTSISKLNFNKEFVVTGINYVNGFLFWTDNYNPPRKINISRVKADVNGNGGYNIDDPRIDQDISVIMAPPLNAPKLRFENTEDPTLLDQANNMEDRFLYFSYRYKYIDNQYSALSPFSAVAFQAKDYLVDYNAGFNKAMLNKYNRAYITIFTGSEFINEIQIIMRDARSLNTFIVDTINKETLNISDNIYREIEFSNDKTYSVLSPEQLTRLFDNVPLLAKAQDYVGNRIMYGNYTQFYDVFEQVRIGVAYKSYDIPTEGAPIQTFRSDRDYQIGIQYLDSYGRTTTVLAPDNQNISSTIYIPPSQSNKGNSLKVSVWNRPPQWATNYRLVIKQGKREYYNIFPIYFYLKDQFRYFLIHESDKDKIPVGGYVIFKCTAIGPTFSNKKYKVIELKSQPKNFIQGAQAGLYFKIKVDSPLELNNTLGLNTFFTDSSGFSATNSIQGTIVVNPNSSVKYAESPIYYGNANANALTLSSPPTNPAISPNRYNFNGSYRITVQVISTTQFRWTNAVEFNGSWITANISLNTPYWINLGTSSLATNQQLGLGVWIVWNTQPVIGDSWKINLRGERQYQYFTAGSAWPTDLTYVPLAIDVYVDQQVIPGDIIEIKINETLNPNADNTTQTFYSNGSYANLEEWFVESLAYQDFKYTDRNGVPLNENAISFRRGYNYTDIVFTNTTQSRITSGPTGSNYSTILSSPMFMIIRGSGGGPDVNRMSASITLRRFDNTLIAETAPEENDLDVYHELSRTFPIRNNLHNVVWTYADATIYPGSAPFGGYTNLGQLNTSTAPLPTDQMHNYVVGESIYVTTNNPNLPNGYYEILATPNPYNVIIDYVMFTYTSAYAGTAGYDIDERNQTTSATVPAIIMLNNPLATVNSDFNAWAYGNGLETNRIRDDWNGFTLQYSPRTSAIIDGYGRKVSRNAICYSSIYGENTGINRLNEFNLSTANFKYLDGEYGSIQKLYARESDVLVLQEDKISIVLYEKNILSDATGGGSVASIPEVLGNQVMFPHEYGISKNPESFATWGSDAFFTDARRGVVLAMSDNQLVEISDTGMKNYFIDLLRDYPNTQKLGAYDPNNQLYTLSNNSITILGCTLALSRNQWSVGRPGGNNFNLFTIITDVNWSLSLVDNGFGTNWVTGFQTSGYQSSDIFADVAVNTANVVRSVIFRVTYCGNTVDFTLIQGRSKPIVLNVVVNHEPPPKTNN